MHSIFRTDISGYRVGELMFEIGIIRILDRPFNFYKYIVFPTDAEYSFFPTDFRLKILL